MGGQHRSLWALSFAIVPFCAIAIAIKLPMFFTLFLILFSRSKKVQCGHLQLFFKCDIIISNNGL